MPEYVTREEFEARVGVLEREVDGEKMVTRHILEQTRRNGDDLAAIRTRLQRVETDVGQVKTDVGSLESELRGLRQDLPGIVSEAVREAMGRKKQK